MSKQEQHPPKWMLKAYRLLSTGRYAAMWVPELIRLYGLTVEEDGEDAVKDWLAEELQLSMLPSLAAKLFPVVRFGYKLWRRYKKAR